jgi:hypothetical protein
MFQITHTITVTFARRTGRGKSVYVFDGRGAQATYGMSRDVRRRYALNCHGGRGPVFTFRYY